MADQATACPQCGTAHSPAAANPAQPAGQEAGLSQNTAATLSYALGWLTGLIFLLIDKRPYVKFHAAQSLVTFGALHLLLIVMAMFFGVGFFMGGGMGGWGLVVMIFFLLRIAMLVLWILLMIKASQGNRFKLPVAGDLAEGIAGKQI
jgi:uncharacterized membrane protein